MSKICTGFSKLPAEIREEIWEYALPSSRIVKIEWKATAKSSGTNSNLASSYMDLVPAMLHICRQSRAIALEIYTLVACQPFTKQLLYINLYDDIVHIKEQHTSSLFSNPLYDLRKIANVKTSRLLGELRNLALDNMGGRLLARVHDFECLKHLHLLQPIQPYCPNDSILGFFSVHAENLCKEMLDRRDLALVVHQWQGRELLYNCTVDGTLDYTEVQMDN